MLPTTLAALIIKRIIEDGGSTYDKLEARAVKKGISMNTFEAAMVIVHRSKLIEQSVKYGVIQYKVAEKKVEKPFSAAEWVTENYPWPGKNGIPVFEMPFPEIDMSYLFLTPEEMDKYRAEAAGRTYIPKKRYATKNH